MKWFLLNVGEILIDKIHIPLIQNCNWAMSGMGYIYATSGKYRNQFLHKIIAEKAGLDISNQIDHKDLNKLNNQLSNLRPATKSQNRMNSKMYSNNTTSYKGVDYHKASQKYRPRIQVNGKRISLGYFDDPKEASEARKQAAIEYHGEFARF